jgi:hypothetical protein
MTTNEPSFQSLFSQFDEVAERGTQPLPPPSTALTHSRAPDLWTRLVRAAVQGWGLVAIFLALELAVLASGKELVLSLMGLLLATFLATPLLGARPMAQPLRWAGVLLLATVLATGFASLARWPVYLASSFNAPLSALVLATCSVVEKATAPSLLATLAVTTALLYAGGRMLSRSHPWIETRVPRRPWRQALSLGTLGLLLGLLAALPLLHSRLWNQPWMAQVKLPRPGSSSQSFSRAGDLSAILTGRQAREDVDFASAVRGLSKEEFLQKASQAGQYLSETRELTVVDLAALAELLNRGLTEAPEPRLEELFWSAYLHAFRNELGWQMGWQATMGLRRFVLPELCNTTGSPQMLETWSRRLDQLVIIKPVARRATDALFLERLSQYRPGFPNSLGHRAEFQRPLHLFGLPTRWKPADLALEAERSLALLVYSRLRREISETELLRPEVQLAPPYTRNRLFDQPLKELYASITTENSFPFAAADAQLFGIILELKKARLENGIYPASWQVPPELEYESSGPSARLRTPRVLRTSHLHFDETLR